jgi:hypothetical protein
VIWSFFGDSTVLFMSCSTHFCFSLAHHKKKITSWTCWQKKSFHFIDATNLDMYYTWMFLLTSVSWHKAIELLWQYYKYKNTCNLVHFSTVLKLWPSFSSTRDSHTPALKLVLHFERPLWQYQVVPHRTFTGGRQWIHTGFTFILPPNCQW